MPRQAQYDLTDADAVAQAYEDARPQTVVHLAAEVGGIGANRDNPGRYFYANMAMGLHLIEEARKRRLGKFVQVGHRLRLPQAHARCRSTRTTSGTATPRRPTRPTGSPRRRCW